MLDGKPLLQLPDRNVETCWLDFTPAERVFYDYMNSKLQDQAENMAELNRGFGQGGSAYMNYIGLIMRLRQAVCHPRLTKALSSSETAGLRNQWIKYTQNVINDNWDEIKKEVNMLPPQICKSLSEKRKEVVTSRCLQCRNLAQDRQILVRCGHIACYNCLESIQSDAECESKSAKCPTCQEIFEIDRLVSVSHFLRWLDHKQTSPLPSSNGSDDNSLVDNLNKMNISDSTTTITTTDTKIAEDIAQELEGDSDEQGAKVILNHPKFI